MKKIVFVTGTLADGGAQKVMSLLASGCAELGCDVTLVVLRNNKIVYPVSEKVDLIQLKETGCFISVKRIRRLRKILKCVKPDVVIPFLNTISVYTILANLGLEYNMVFSVRADPNIPMDDASLKDKLGRFFMRKLKWNEKAKWTVFQTPDAQACYSEVIQKKSSVIPNPIDSTNLPEKFMGEREKRVVAAGRLALEKNFSLLIQAFFEFKKKHPEYSLTIYGEGEERENLDKLVQALRLNDSVKLPGFSANLVEEVYKAGMYVSTSNHEGISNSMLEALGMGIPTIVTDCPIGGARMFIKTDYNGILIPMGDKRALIKALNKIAENPDYADSISEAASNIRNEISVKTICQKWIDVINNYDLG